MAGKRKKNVEVIDQAGLTAADRADMARIHSQLAAEKAAAEALNAPVHGPDEVYKEWAVDPHEQRLATIRRGWFKLSPSLCPDEGCVFDAAVAMGFTTGWEEINPALRISETETVRERAEKILSQHIALRHPPATAKTRTAAQAHAARKGPQLPEGFIVNPAL
jgi:hypothetical protein